MENTHVVYFVSPKAGPWPWCQDLKGPPSSPIVPNSWELAGVRVSLSGRHHGCMADLEMT